MGKLKEKLINNLTEEQWEEMVGEISAFEYVEYMSKQKSNWVQLSLFDNEQIPNEVLEQMSKEQSKLEQEFFEDGWTEEMERRYWAEQPISYQNEIDEINNDIKIKYSDSDVLLAISKINNEQWIKDGVMNVLNDIYRQRNGLN